MEVEIYNCGIINSNRELYFPTTTHTDKVIWHQNKLKFSYQVLLIRTMATSAMMCILLINYYYYRIIRTKHIKTYNIYGRKCHQHMYTQILKYILNLIKTKYTNYVSIRIIPGKILHKQITILSKNSI